MYTEMESGWAPCYNAKGLTESGNHRKQMYTEMESGWAPCYNAYLSLMSYPFSITEMYP